MGASKQMKDMSLPAPVDPNDPLLAPIAGIDLARYAQVSKAIAHYSLRTQEQIDDYLTRAGHLPTDWQAAADGWNARFKTNTGLSMMYAEHYGAVAL